jgi:hypothetical protein
MDPKAILTAVLPKQVIAQVRAYLRNRPSKDVFSQIYEKNIWGGANGQFFSGLHFGGTAYAAAIRQYIHGNDIASALDLGCGDFAIGGQIAPACLSYTGADVVPRLIERNSRLFGSAKVKFVCLDMITDRLPDADLCLILQTFQHLSNRDIITVLRKARKFPHLIVSEHQPCRPVNFNTDQPRSAGLRLYIGSGVYLDKPPFNAQKLELLFEAKVVSPFFDPAIDWGMIRTFRVVL